MSSTLSFWAQFLSVMQRFPFSVLWHQNIDYIHIYKYIYIIIIFKVVTKSTVLQEIHPFWFLPGILDLAIAWTSLPLVHFFYKRTDSRVVE